MLIFQLCFDEMFSEMSNEKYDVRHINYIN